MVAVAAFLFPLCVLPLVSSFCSLLCLLSCLRAVVIPLFVFLCLDSIPPLFCFLNSVSYYAQFIAQSEWVLSPLFIYTETFPFPPPSRCRALLPLHPVPDRRATAYTVHTCLVSRCNVCIS